MMRDAELDRILRDWLATGPDRAPLTDVEAALAQIATTGQRRRRLPPTLPAIEVPDYRWWLAAALLALLLGLAFGVVTGRIRLVSDSRLLTVTPTAPPSSSPAVALRPIHVDDWAAEVSIPATWSDVGEPIVEFRHFAGTAPEGHLSVGHESPYWTSVCSPDCEAIEIPETIPYDATAQLGALKARVAAIAGSDDWAELPPGVLPTLQGGSLMDTTGFAKDGRSWRRVHIVGLVKRNVVAIAWSQPVETFDEALLEQVLDEIHLLPAPGYSDGDLVPASVDGAFTMPIPGVWHFEDQPSLGAVPLSGVHRFAEGRVVVSLGTRDGTVGWCDPDCHRATEVTSLDVLEAAIRDARDLGPSTEATLGGEPARRFGTTTPVERRFAVALHGGRPVVVMIDVGDWTVGPGILDQMFEGFAFADLEPATIDQVFTTADGRVELGLSDAWGQSARDDGLFTFSRQLLTVRVGDADGTIQTCTDPAGPWELCRTITATTLDELAAAVQPAPIADHGVGPPTPRVEFGTLGGEPSVVTRIQAYEYPARSGQEVVYIVAMRHGRPVIARLWTSNNTVRDLESVIAGFRFVD